MAEAIGPAEQALRNEVEAEVRAELLADHDTAVEIDRAKRAILITRITLWLMVVIVGVPAVGGALGLAVRVFLLASGLR